jgi:hypothetical protein
MGEAMEEKCKISCLSGNALKIIAAISMALDHIGFVFFPKILFFRILGRIALPIFAFMIAEGCKYTRNKLRYFLTIFLLGSIFQVVFYIVERSFYLGVLMTFSCGILAVYSLMFVKKAWLSGGGYALKLLSVLSLVFMIVGISVLNEYVVVDYGFYGCILPLFAALFHHDGKGGYENDLLKRCDHVPVHALSMGVGMLLLALDRGGIQFYSFLALPLLLLYSGKRGKWKMKYFFYIFYPAHLAIIYGIAMLTVVMVF